MAMRIDSAVELMSLAIWMVRRIWYKRLQRLETEDFKYLCSGNSFNITREASICELHLHCKSGAKRRYIIRHIPGILRQHY
ncbi:hypothetical protein VN97_g11585 [Penicillium thymicola]|uniref:Uncharacterized protein n=1 Tax=Penicillium thymicola TaxID=293382 RepID=A0AAI9X2S0_PENTH|nr:hypothetical protein VN97_g11585 [Penicillium thymicola]